MNKHIHTHGDIGQQLREQLGRDIDADIIESVAQHMQKCPDCKIYIDSVLETVNLYKVTESEQSLPQEVSERLFKTLDLKKVKK